MTHITEQIESYLAGGVFGEELAAFEAHLAECESCRAALAAARSADASLAGLFAGERPAAGFEDRVIQDLRQRQPRLSRPIVNPWVRRAAVGVAASLLLAGIGYAGTVAMNGGAMTWLEGNAGRRIKASANMRQIGLAMATYGNGRDYLAYNRSVTEDQAVSRMSRSDRTANHTSSKDLVSGVVGGLAHGGASGETAQKSEQKRAPEGLGWGESPGDVNRSIAWGYNASAGPEASFKRDIGNSRDGKPGANSPANLYYGLGANVPPSGGFGGGRTSTGKGELAERADYFKVDDLSQGVPNFTDAPDFSLNLGRSGGKIEKKLPVATKTPAAKPLSSAGEPELKQREFAELGRKLDRVTHGNQLNRGEDGKGAFGDVLHYPTDGSDANPAIEGTPGTTGRVRGDLGVNAQGPMTGASVAAAGASQAPPAPATDLPAPASHAPAAAHADTSRKIIRSGEMEFEVDSFDTASNTIAKVVIEEGGYVSTTNSDKLPNGKVKGSIILRVPPDHLDTLVLKLRGIGDLRTQRIGAQDITKQYTDLQSALTAAQAMYDRLIDIVKTGKGQVKDLLEAEKQLGVWREKLEQLKGEINYYNNMVSLSTLTVTLFERDIRTPAFASETETVNMNFETEKVEESYAKVREAIAAAKGRIVASELKQFDAGQLGGKITAQLPPDAADGVINRIRQLDGRVTHFERQHSQSLSNGGAPADQRATDPLKVKREDVTLSLTLYNLANVAPRRTTSLTLVAGNVEEAYRALIAQVRSAGGRVITSQINRPKPDQVAGSVSFNVPAEKADVVLAALRGAGEVLGTDTAEAPDSLNVTESKRGFNVTVASLSAFQARESQQVQLAAANVPEVFNDLLTAVRAKGGRILTSQLNEQDARNATGKLDFEVARESVAAIDQAMRKGQVISRGITRSTDTQNTVDSKVLLAVQIGAAATLPPRQTTQLSVETNDVQKSLDDLVAAALAAGGRQMDSPAFSQAEGGQTTATVVFDVPLDQVRGLVDKADAMGSRKGRSTSIDANAPEGKLARARVQVTFASPAGLAGKEDGLWAGIRNGLGTSLRFLSGSLALIIFGLCVVVPWIVVIWIGWRLARFARGRKENVNAPAGTALGT